MKPSESSSRRTDQVDESRGEMTIIQRITACLPVILASVIVYVTCPEQGVGSDRGKRERNEIKACLYPDLWEKRWKNSMQNH